MSPAPSDTSNNHVSSPATSQSRDLMKASGIGSPNEGPADSKYAWERFLAWPLAIAWAVLFASLSTRQHLVMMYEAFATLPWHLEPLAANYSAIGLGLFLAAIWLLAILRTLPIDRNGARLSLLGIATAVTVTCVSSIWSRQGDDPLRASFFDPILLSFLSGLAVYPLVVRRSAVELPRSWDTIAIVIASVTSAAWGWRQSHRYFENFSLGFNDLGHFAQRIASTAAGRGILLETPVLPPFWDHFNPGLLLLVPFWKIWPSLEMLMLLHAISLASGGWFFWKIAKAIGLSRISSLLWGLGWFLHPCVSQMNLAYTYGWHPVNFALPFLLWALLSVIQGRNRIALLATILAMSFEENVIVLVSLWSFFRVVRATISMRFNKDRLASTSSPLDGSLRTVHWLSIFVVTAIAFVMVYQFSGLARFQTGRFAALGATPTEIILSPILKPERFWGEFLSYRSFIWMACLTLPCFLPALFRAPGCWAVTLLPASVLLVWEHLPAKSIAFQYPTTIVPVLWLAAIVGSSTIRGDRKEVFGRWRHFWNEAIGTTTLDRRRALAASLAALVTSLVMTSFLGQMPWSGPTLSEVESRNYGLGEPLQRKADEADGKWLLEQVKSLAAKKTTVLCTGRIATHFVGSTEIETVGQFIQRRSDLDRLPDAPQNALQRYEVIVLDRREAFQQTREETKQIEAEAKSIGYNTLAEQFDIIILVRE